MSTYALCAEIIFPAISTSTRTRQELDMKWINSVSIESSFKDLTDVAEIVLPRNIRFGKNKNDKTRTETLNTLLQTGDPLQIYLGYNGNLIREFNGYITEVSTGIPVTIRCEDAMYNLKRTSKNISETNINLKDLLTKITGLGADQINCMDVDLGQVRFSNLAPTQILDILKEKRGIYTYFIDGDIYSGIRYGDVIGDDPPTINLEKNGIEESLKIKEAPQSAYIKAFSLQKGGDKLQVVLGDEGGDTYVFPHVGITSEDALRTIAENDLKLVMQPGLDGDITLFGTPTLAHSMKINFISKKYAEKNGLYYIDCVNKQFDESGYRQTITLGDKVS